MPSPLKTDKTQAQKISPGSKKGQCRICKKETTVYKIVYYICCDCMNPNMTEEEKQLTLEFYLGRDENNRPRPATLSHGETIELTKAVDSACRKHNLIKEDFIRNCSKDRGECESCAIEPMCGRNTNTKKDGMCESYIRSKKPKKSKNPTSTNKS